MGGVEVQRHSIFTSAAHGREIYLMNVKVTPGTEGSGRFPTYSQTRRWMVSTKAQPLYSRERLYWSPDILGTVRNIISSRNAALYKVCPESNATDSRKFV